MAAESARATDTGQVHTDPPRVMHQLPAPPGAPFRALPDGPARPSVTVTQRNFTIRSLTPRRARRAAKSNLGRPNCVRACFRFTRTTQRCRERVFACQPESPPTGFRSPDGPSSCGTIRAATWRPSACGRLLHAWFTPIRAESYTESRPEHRPRAAPPGGRGAASALSSSSAARRRASLHGIGGLSSGPSALAPCRTPRR